MTFDDDGALYFCDGTYYVNLEIDGAAVEITSLNGAGTTVLSGANTGSVIEAHSGADLTLSGVQIQDGGGYQGGGINLFERMVMLRALQDDERFAKCCGKTRVKGGVPLLVLLAEPDHDDIGLFDPSSGADGVHHRTLMVVPVLVRLVAQDGHAAIIRGGVIGDRAGETYIQTYCAVDDLVTPVRVNLAREIDVQGHVEASGSLGQTLT